MSYDGVAHYCAAHSSGVTRILSACHMVKLMITGNSRLMFNDLPIKQRNHRIVRAIGVVALVSTINSQESNITQG